MQGSLNGYRVALLVPRAGINDAQLAVVRRKLELIAKCLAEGVNIELYIPCYGVTDPEATVPLGVRNLIYKHRVKPKFLPYESKGEGAAAYFLRYLTKEVQFDEVWACTLTAPTRTSKERVSQVYTRGQETALARIFKLIPPWVENPEHIAQSAEKPKRKSRKGERKW
jgi:hypothetical protein